jgi:hypothetical protein
MLADPHAGHFFSVLVGMCSGMATSSSAPAGPRCSTEGDTRCFMSASPTPGSEGAEGAVNMPEDIRVSTDKKCPACASTTVHEVPTNIGTGTQDSQVAHLWSCEKCRNAFRLVEAAGDQRDPHFNL